MTKSTVGATILSAITGDGYTISGTVETDSSVGIGVAEFSCQGPLTEMID